MATKASAQKTLIDLTDGYAVILSNDNHTFSGTETSVNGTQSITCEVQAMCGADQVACTVGDITTPNGLSIVSNGKTPVPTLTITATSALAASGSVIIPVVIGDITINKVFSWSIAFKGAAGEDGTSVTVKSTSVTYQAGDSGTTAPTGTWLTSIPTVAAGKYLWTKTVVTYSDGKSTTSYSVSYKASDGAGVTVKSSTTAYQAGSSGTTVPSGTWLTSIPAVSAGQYLWTKTVVTYSDGNSTTSYSVSRNGVDGSDGEDAVTMVITSSNGDIFKNTAIATTLTAHVYKGGAEVTGASLAALGTVYWYKDGGTASIASGSTLTINAGDVDSCANYTAQLEG